MNGYAPEYVAVSYIILLLTFLLVLLHIVAFQKSCVSMFHERLTHSLHCSEFVEFTLCIAKVVLTGTFITTLRLAVYIEIITDLKLTIALIHLQ